MDSITLNNFSPSVLGAGQPLAAPEVDKQQFLDLLVNQLKAQDPFEPLANEAFLSQLATFSQLEEQQQTTALMRSLLAMQEAQLALGGLAQGASLVGKTVEYLDPQTGEQIRGQVYSVYFDPSGVLVEVNGQIVPAGNIVIISTGPTPPPPAATPAPAGGTGAGSVFVNSEADGGPV